MTEEIRTASSTTRYGTMYGRPGTTSSLVPSIRPARPLNGNCSSLIAASTIAPTTRDAAPGLSFAICSQIDVRLRTARSLKRAFIEVAEAHAQCRGFSPIQGPSLPRRSCLLQYRQSLLGSLVAPIPYIRLPQQTHPHSTARAARAPRPESMSTPRDRRRQDLPAAATPL